MSERPESAFERWGYKLPIGFYINDFHVDSFELGPVRGSLRRQLANLMAGPSRGQATRCTSTA